MNRNNKNGSNDARHPSDDEVIDEGSIFEKVMPDGIRRGLDSLLRDGPLKNIVGDFKWPKEIITHVMSQVDETKHAALGVISREMRLFLERTNLADEMAKLLTQISFEVKTQVRFVPSDKAIKRDKQKASRLSETPSQRRSKTPSRPVEDSEEYQPEETSSIPPKESNVKIKD
ncbi:MAG: hypothetical protein GY847_24295 [Proteobacteria bacterium]|nr:hypothetical protein [Pseudomonadota bacterium]